ncbi:MAG: ATP-binding protein [Nitrospiria bacterium]
MVIFAIDLFGIRPFDQPKRILLKPGMNAVIGPNGSGKTMTFRTLSSLFVNTPFSNIVTSQNRPAQAAVTFRSQNGGFFRIARDYQKGAWNLSKMDSGTRTFSTVETDRDKIGRWLRQESGGLDDQKRGLLFFIDRFRYPSHLSSSKKDGLLPLPECLSDITNSGREAEAEAQTQHSALKQSKNIQSLKTLEKKQSAMEAEYEDMLRLQDEAASIQKRINQCHALDAKIAQIEAEEEKKFPLFASEGTLLPDLLSDYETDQVEKKTALGEIAEERKILEDAFSALKNQESGFLKDRFCQAGTVLVAAAFLLPFLITLSGFLRYLFLAGIFGGSGLCIFAYLRILRRVAVRRKIKTEQRHLTEAAQRLEDGFRETHREVVAFMQKTGSQDIASLKTAQSTFTNLVKQKQNASEEKAHILQGERIEALEDTVKSLADEAEKLKEKLQGFEEITSEIYRLQEETRGEHSRLLLPSSPMKSSVFSFPELEAGPADTAEDCFMSSILAVAKGGSSDSKRRQLQEDVGRLYDLFRPGKSGTIRVNEDGRVFEGSTPLNRLSSGMADQVFLSITLSVVEQFEDVAFPILLDDPFFSFDKPSKEIAGKIIRDISKHRQVIFFSNETLPSTEDGHQIQLA